MLGKRDFPALTRRGMSARAALAAVALMLVALVAFGGEALAENECGPPEPGVEITCSPSNYDHSRYGNIFYGPDEANNTDFTIRLTDDLVLNYDRDNPGDDFYIPPDDPEQTPRYSAVWISPGEPGYTGDISVFSSADVTSNARGISVGHYGESGALRMELTGGNFTTMGERAFAIHSYHGSEGNIDVIARNLTVNTSESLADAIVSFHLGEGNINIDVRDVTFAVMDFRADGIHAQHHGEKGNVNIHVQNSDITTMGMEASGVHGSHESEGGIVINVEETAISTMGADAFGLHGSHAGTGAIAIDARDATITTTAQGADGILGFHGGVEGDILIRTQGGGITTKGAGAEGILASRTSMGDIGIDVSDITIKTEGEGSEGIHGLHRDDGETRIKAQGAEVTTIGEQAFGIRGSHTGAGNVDIDVRDTIVTTNARGADGIYGLHVGVEGDILIRVQSGGITTKGVGAEGILANHNRTGEIDIDVHGVTITTEGEGAEGIHGLHQRQGGVSIRAQGVNITTMGREAFGIRSSHGAGAGEIDIDVQDTTITTTNENAHGVLAYHAGPGPIRIAIDGGTIRTTGTDASGVQVGRLSPRGAVSFAAEVGEDGYRKQSVTVNGRVFGGSGEGAGVFLAGGGKVIIGPEGSLGADSGAAVRAAGDAPKLYIDMNLGGRRVREAIGAHHIMNDGGETTIVMGGVTLHDGAAGATGVEAPNGAWDVTLAAREVIADRDFSARDFTEIYAPRAAVYEALPGLLLHLNRKGPVGKRLASPGSPIWVRFSGGSGSYEPEHSSVGAEYDFNRFEALAGLDLTLGENLTGSFSVRHVRGSADVESLYGDGEIDAKGLGAGVAASWIAPGGYYLDGRVSLMIYDVGVSSQKRGRLKKNAGVFLYSTGFEAGRRIALSEKVKLSPRIWADRSGFLNNRFTDEVGTRVSPAGAARFTLGFGAVAETARTWKGGAFSLRGSLDIEQAFSGVETTADVSGEELRSESTKNRVLLGLGCVYRRGRFSFGAEVSVAGPGSGDREYSGFLKIGVRF